MSDLDRHELARELRARSHDVDGHSIDLDGVTGTARRIQRRRRAAGGVVAVLVLAVGVPTTVAVIDGRNGRVDAPITRQTPSPTHSSSEPTPSPSTDGGQTTARTTLDTVGLPRGDAPALDYLSGTSLVRPDGSVLELDAGYDELTPHWSGFVVVGSDERGNRSAVFLDADGTVRDTVPIVGGLAVSPDRSLVSYATRSGELFVAWDGAGSPVQLDDPDAGRMSPVAVLGQDRCDGTEGVGGCVVYYNIRARQNGAYLSSSHGVVDTLEPLQHLADVSAQGWLAGLTQVTDTGSCSAVLDESGQRQWRTCDYRLDRFSPDGRYVVGLDAYADGFADSQVALLDARTGALVAVYDGSGENGAAVLSTVWEDASHLLTVTFQQGAWIVVRLDTAGHVEQATEALRTDQLDRPYFLPTSP